MRKMSRTIREAMQLMQTGNLVAATRAITCGLAGAAPGPRAASHDASAQMPSFFPVVRAFR
jgi:hypothetical protein